MLDPYYPNISYFSFVVKVYDSLSNQTYWLGRPFRNVKNIINSYIHQKYWKGTVYAIYEYPSLKFVELLTYSDNMFRVEIDTPEAKQIAGDYTMKIK